MKATVVSFMICNIFFPAQLYNIHFLSSEFVYNVTRFYTTVYFSSHILPLPSLSPFYLPLSSQYFHFKFGFLSSYNLFPFHTLTISPPPRHSKRIFLSRVISHPFAQLSKYLCSLYAFNKLCQLVVGRVVVMSFCQGYLQSFTNSVFQISNCTGPLPYFFFHLKF